MIIQHVFDDLKRERAEKEAIQGRRSSRWVRPCACACAAAGNGFQEAARAHAA